MWHNFYTVTSVEEALRLLAEHGERARLIAGGTDLVLEMERRQRPGVETLVDISRVAGLDRIRLDDEGWIRLGPLVTHNQVIASALCVERAFPLAAACWAVGAPQIRNTGTVAGNLITASPANDTIPPLWAMDARLTLRSLRGERTIPLADFYRGVRQVDLAPDEMLVEIAFPALRENQRGTFLKLGLRRAQAIAVVNVAVLLTFDGGPDGMVTDARITLGSVAPTIVRAEEAEALLVGHPLDEERIAQAARLAAQAARPIDDVRGSAAYRRRMVEVFTRRALRQVWRGEERAGWPQDPPLLWGKTNGHFPPLAGRTIVHREGGPEPIQTVVNGRAVTVHGANDKTLLRMLREDVGLTGTKEGCAEGECGACTVLLDGIAVMSCLVPAPRAHGASIVTVEGLREDGRLHPLQEAFIKTGAVQCGYCTPGFLMAGAALLAEKPHPAPEQVRQSITGNLCRCTGYYKILRAFEEATRE
ncbi:MAG TPA: 2Fe-2S iron-sulfur cluster binding domain-containing protein [Chloroflexi bacterium]|nr:2Fe-2S iron-sulfur cluster binding domain-containing protein [Chloroflexota bacterium]